MNINYIMIAILIIAIGAGARFSELDSRPIHLDEAVQAYRSGNLIENGNYKYDLNEYHGPVLQYLTLLEMKLAGADDMTKVSISELRFVPAIAGLLAVAAIFLLYDFLGKIGALFAGIFCAVSPVMVYYSRYYIHEMVLVFAAACVLGFIWRYFRAKSLKMKLIWLGTTAFFSAIMFATKETFVLTFASMLLAGLIVLVLDKNKFRNNCSNLMPVNKLTLIFSIMIFVLTAGLLFTSFGKNLQGGLDCVYAFGKYFDRGFNSQTDISAGAHDKPFWYYWKILASSKSGNCFASGQFYIVLLAGLGILISFISRINESRLKKNYSIFLSLTLLFLALVYSLIPYKTPWCSVQIYYFIVLLAGFGVQNLYQLVRTKFSKSAFVFVVSVLIVSILCSLQCWQICFTKYSSSPENQYAYQHTLPDLKRLISRVEELAETDKTKLISINVMTENSEYWPAWWYLRGYKNIHFYAIQQSDYRFADIIIATPNFVEKFQTYHTCKLSEHSTPAAYYLDRENIPIRPGVTVDILISHRLKLLADKNHIKETE